VAARNFFNSCFVTSASRQRLRQQVNGLCNFATVHSDALDVAARESREYPRPTSGFSVLKRLPQAAQLFEFVDEWISGLALSFIEMHICPGNQISGLKIQAFGEILPRGWTPQLADLYQNGPLGNCDDNRSAVQESWKTLQFAVGEMAEWPNAHHC
jgi:hypothetical protein